MNSCVFWEFNTIQDMNKENCSPSLNFFGYWSSSVGVYIHVQVYKVEGTINTLESIYDHVNYASS